MPFDDIITVKIMLQITISIVSYILSLYTSPFLYKGGPEIGGIFVKTLLPGGSAEQSGSILVGKDEKIL